MTNAEIMIEALETRRAKLMDEVRKMAHQHGDWQLEILANSIAIIDREIARLHEAN